MVQCHDFVRIELLGVVILLFCFYSRPCKISWSSKVYKAQPQLNALVVTPPTRCRSKVVEWIRWIITSHRTPQRQLDVLPMDINGSMTLLSSSFQTIALSLIHQDACDTVWRWGWLSTPAWPLPPERERPCQRGFPKAENELPKYEIPANGSGNGGNKNRHCVHLRTHSWFVEDFEEHWAEQRSTNEVLLRLYFVLPYDILETFLWRGFSDNHLAKFTRDLNWKI